MKKLLLSNKNKMIGGVCGGIGEYFNIDPTIIRIIFILLTFIFLGSPIIIYIIFWIVIPSVDKDKIVNINEEDKHKEGFYDFSEFDNEK